MIYLFSEVNVFVKPPIQSLTLAISPRLMDLLVWTYEHAVYQRFIRTSRRPNVCQSSRRDSVSEIKFSTVHMLHLRQEYVLKIQSNIFIVLPEMEEYWFIHTNRTPTGLLEGCLALHRITHACWYAHANTAVWSSSNLTTRSVACLSQSLGTFCTLYLSTQLIHCSPVMPHTRCRELTLCQGRGQRHGQQNVSWS